MSKYPDWREEPSVKRLDKELQALEAKVAPVLRERRDIELKLRRAEAVLADARMRLLFEGPSRQPRPEELLTFQADVEQAQAAFAAIEVTNAQILKDHREAKAQYDAAAAKAKEAARAEFQRIYAEAAAVADKAFAAAAEASEKLDEIQRMAGDQGLAFHGLTWRYPALDANGLTAWRARRRDARAFSGAELARVDAEDEKRERAEAEATARRRFFAFRGMPTGLVSK